MEMTGLETWFVDNTVRGKHVNPNLTKHRNLTHKYINASFATNVVGNMVTQCHKVMTLKPTLNTHIT